MVTLRFDHVGLVVDDLAVAVTFFEVLGLEVEGRAPIEGSWVDRLSGLENVRCEIVMLKTPDGSGRVELTTYESPQTQTPSPDNSCSAAMGWRSVMFEVEDIDHMVGRLAEAGGELIGEIVQYENFYRLAYVRGPGAAIVALAENISDGK